MINCRQLTRAKTCGMILLTIALCCGMTVFANTPALDRAAENGQLAEFRQILSDLCVDRGESDERCTLHQEIVEWADLPDERAQVLADSYRAQESRFERSYAGPIAYAMYHRSLELTNTGDYQDAVAAYRVARFYKLRHLVSRTDNARDLLGRVRQLKVQGKLHQAIALLDNLPEPSQQNLELVAISDSLQFERTDIESELQRQARVERGWARSSLPRYFYAIMISPEIYPSMAVDAFPLPVTRDSDGRSLRFDLSSVGTDPGIGWAVEIRRPLTERLQLTATASVLRISYSGSGTVSNLFFDFDVNYYSLRLGGIYLLRPYVGLQPFVRGAAGLARYSREESQVTYLPAGVPDSLAILYTAAEETHTTATGFVAAGIQYVPSATSSILFGLEIGLLHNFDAGDYLNDVSPAVSLRFGYMW